MKNLVKVAGEAVFAVLCFLKALLFFLHFNSSDFLLFFFQSHNPITRKFNFCHFLFAIDKEKEAKRPFE